MQRAYTPSFTPQECDVIYQLLFSSDELWNPTAEEVRICQSLCRRKHLQTRRHLPPAVPQKTFESFRQVVLRGRDRSSSLSDEDNAYVCTIRQMPEYEFVGPELRRAREMEAQGLLRAAKLPRRFLVTIEGYQRYRWDTVERPH